MVPTDVNCGDTATEVLDDILRNCNRKRTEILQVMATGYGRRLLHFADDVISETTANVKEVLHSCRHLDGAVRTIINIGGQDSKVTDLGSVSLTAAVPVKMNSTCAVFAESEIISLIERKKDPTEIIAGAHFSIARRMARMARRIGIEDNLVFDGGSALNTGLATALKDELATEVHISSKPQITVGLVAAILAKENWEKEQKKRIDEH